MRRMVWILAVLGCTACAQEASAEPVRSLMRFLGIHCGHGYHAYNGEAPYVIDDAYLRPVEPDFRRRVQPPLRDETPPAPAPPRVDEPTGEPQSFRSILRNADTRSSRRTVR